MRALLPPSASPVRSSRFTSRRAGEPIAAASRSSGSSGVGRVARRGRVGHDARVRGARRHQHVRRRAGARRRRAPSRPRSSGPSAAPGTRSRRRTGRWKTRTSQLPLPRLAGEVPVGVHRDRVADRLEHRQVGDRVAVRVRRREVDALALRDLADRVGLVRAVRVELELAGVEALVVDLRPWSRSPRRRRGTRRAGRPPRTGADETMTTWRPAAWCWSNSSSASANTIGEITSSRVSRTMSAMCCWFQPLVSDSIASRSFSIFASSAPTSMKTICA